MTRYLLDTGIASDLINRRNAVQQKAREAMQRGDRLGIGTPVLGELVGGVEHCNDPPRQRKALQHGLRGIALWPFDSTAAWEYGRTYAELRRLGRPMQQVDIQIAAIALTLGDCIVVTKDSDLSDVPGLKVENWSQS